VKGIEITYPTDSGELFAADEPAAEKSEPRAARSAKRRSR
jgi:hypothetical protein